jgi:hypothetical protein
LLLLANACPRHAQRFYAASLSLRAEQEPEPLETYVPRTLSPEMEELLEAHLYTGDQRHAIVHRVLRDL